jgi:hypothetical protein
MVRRTLAALLAAGAALAAAAPAHAAATWRLEQPPQPAGMPYPVPLGAPGDLKLLSPSRGLLTVSGNAAAPEGVYTWDGRTWRPYMTVCGGADVSARIAVAGPDDFWVIADPAAELRVQENGTTLCHVRDGAIVASYAARPDGPDPYAPMDAAACAAPTTCWFGGPAAEAGGRRGAFHLRWDGTQLTSAYDPQARGVSDIEAFDGDVWESTFAGPGPGIATAPSLLAPEPQPVLLKRLQAGAFVPDPFVAPAGTELLALDADADHLWAAGGGATSGDGVPPDTGIVPAGPLLLVRRPGGSWARVPVASGDGTPFAADDRFIDVAAVPGTDTAWVAVERFSDAHDPLAPARVALIDSHGNVLEDDTLPADGAPRGTAERIDCASPTECWMATSGGWLFHLTDGAALAQDQDPAYAGTLSARPDDARTPQRILDTLPEDDSRLFAPPPPQTQPPPPRQRVKRLPALVSHLKAHLHGRHELVLSFRLARKARVGLVGRRHRKVVARARARTLRPGRRTIVLRVDPRRWPTSLRFTTKELTRPGAKGSAAA